MRTLKFKKRRNLRSRFFQHITNLIFLFYVHAREKIKNENKKFNEILPDKFAKKKKKKKKKAKKKIKNHVDREIKSESERSNEALLDKSAKKKGEKEKAKKKRKRIITRIKR